MAEALGLVLTPGTIVDFELRPKTGAPVFAVITGTPIGAAFAGSLVFLPGDLAKVVVTVLVAKGVHRAWPGLIAPRPWPWKRGAVAAPSA